MYISIIILVVLTSIPLFYVFSLEKTEQDRISIGRIICFFVHGSLVFCTYGMGAVNVVKYYLNASRLENNYQPLGAGPGIGFAWLLVLVGLFCLRQWLGVIFNRVDTVWYSDEF